MKIFFLYSTLLFLIKYNLFKCDNITCFEYSCAECDSENYGDCKKCRPGFHLIDGTCPCQDKNCALCTTGLAGLNICKLCKNGYYRMEDNCECEVEHCEICEGYRCLKCYEGYFYNIYDKTCRKYMEGDPNRLNCSDPNCDICISEEQGACDTCKDGYYYEKGECFKSPDPVGNSCETRFYFSDNICKQKCLGVECNDNNFYYSLCPINRCLVCENNELKIFSQCNNKDICTKEGCLNCVTDDYCLVCDQGYYLIGGICKKCTYGCSLCTNSDTCNYCMSGFELNQEKKCELKDNNSFDFSIKKYNYYKYDLIKRYYPNEVYKIEIPEDIDVTEKCDPKCNKCYDSSGRCIECQQLYILDENNKCVKHCSNENCLDCFISYGSEVCSSCKQGYKLDLGKCVYDCSDSNCLSCHLFQGKELCTQCLPGFNLDNYECKDRNRVTEIIWVVIVSLAFLALITTICIYRYRRLKRRAEMFRANYRENRMNIVPYNHNNGLDSSNRIINKGAILDEFEKYKSKMEKKNNLCQVCKKKPGKFQCNCGCIVCKEHSNLKTKEKDGEKIKTCFNCGKVVTKVEPVKYDCNICLQKKINVVHFKCGCAFVVCKECYLKCRMESNKCPGCRAILD